MVEFGWTQNSTRVSPSDFFAQLLVSMETWWGSGAILEIVFFPPQNYFSLLPHVFLTGGPQFALLQ